MAENYDLIFGQSASQQYAWSDSDYQNGWQTVGSTPPTAEQFDALQRRSDTKAQDLNNRLEPIESKSEADGRQAATSYTAGAMVTVDGLPNGWLLQCIVPGISGTDAITLPDTLIDGLTIIDGDVTWALRKVATNGGIGYRQPSTAYTARQIAYHSALPTGYYLECTTQGITSAGEITPSNTIGDTVTDGTVVWTVQKGIGTGNAPLVAGFNAKQTFTSSGTFTPTVTGVYKITLQGGGGGGAGAALGSSGKYSGGGGGSGARVETYEKLTAGTSYSFTIGAGGAGGEGGSEQTGSTTDSVSKGANGGATTITVNSNSYVASGGQGGQRAGYTAGKSGAGGSATKNNSAIPCSSAAGDNGYPLDAQLWSTVTANWYHLGGNGGMVDCNYGYGGEGGEYASSRINNGAAGGDGYITFEWQTASLA